MSDGGRIANRQYENHIGWLAGERTYAIARVPAELGPLRVVLWAFEPTVTLFEENRPMAGPGQAVIAQTPALQERQMAKAAAVTQTVAGALRSRGVDAGLASLTAATGMAIASYALGAWFNDASVLLVEQFRRAFLAAELAFS